MQWICSSGGPLAVLNWSSKNIWQGVDSNHYDKACEFDDYLSKLEVNSEVVLLIGDEPFDTSVYDHTDLGKIIVSWEYAKSVFEVQDVLGKLRFIDFKDPLSIIEFSLSEDFLYLFDSAEKGEINNGLKVSFGPGNYLIHTVRFNPNPDLSLILHWFKVCQR